MPNNIIQKNIFDLIDKKPDELADIVIDIKSPKKGSKSIASVSVSKGKKHAVIQHSKINYDKKGNIIIPMQFWNIKASGWNDDEFSKVFVKNHHTTSKKVFIEASFHHSEASILNGWQNNQDIASQLKSKSLTIDATGCVSGNQKNHFFILLFDIHCKSMISYMPKSQTLFFSNDINIGHKIIGNNRDNLIFGSQGSDIIVGQGGDDFLYGQGSSDNISGGNGNDTINGGDGVDFLSGGNHNDTIMGGDGDDYIDGGCGDDFAYGDEGNDTIYGRDGHDYLSGDAGNDIINGGDGHDIIFGGIGSDQIIGDKGDDRLYGEKGNDHISGKDNNDFVHGGDGHDHVIGGSGNDLLNGGRGDDIILGGDDHDIVVLSPGTDYIKLDDYKDGCNAIILKSQMAHGKHFLNDFDPRNDILYIYDTETDPSTLEKEWLEALSNAQYSPVERLKKQKKSSYYNMRVHFRNQDLYFYRDNLVFDKETGKIDPTQFDVRVIDRTISIESIRYNDLHGKYPPLVHPNRNDDQDLITISSHEWDIPTMHEMPEAKAIEYDKIKIKLPDRFTKPHYAVWSMTTQKRTTTSDETIHFYQRKDERYSTLRGDHKPMPLQWSGIQAMLWENYYNTDDVRIGDKKSLLRIKNRDIRIDKIHAAFDDIELCKKNIDLLLGQSIKFDDTQKLFDLFGKKAQLKITYVDYDTTKLMPKYFFRFVEKAKINQDFFSYKMLDKTGHYDERILYDFVARSSYLDLQKVINGGYLVHSPIDLSAPRYMNDDEKIFVQRHLKSICPDNQTLEHRVQLSLIGHMTRDDLLDPNKKAFAVENGMMPLFATQDRVSFCTKPSAIIKMRLYYNNNPVR